MTSPERMNVPNLPAPSRIGQGTVVEQSRAVAEVQAAIVVAQQCPRDTNAALRQMKDACGRMALADRAFFRYPRGGEQVSGPTIHVARELARCWGNIQYGVAELRRDDDAGQSEMVAFAWDCQTNARTSTTFIVPHRRDTKTGTKALTEMRDIYENNANNGARRVREMIFGVLPTWFTEEALDLCSRTLEAGDGTPLPELITKTTEVFGKLGVTPEQLAAKTGSPLASWTANDVAQMRVVYNSIRRGETTREREFETEAPGLTAADIAPRGEQKAERKPRQRRQAAPVEDVPLPPDPDAPYEPVGGAERAPVRAASGQVGIIHSHFERLGYEKHDREERIIFTAKLAGIVNGDLETSKDLTQDQARAAIDRLKEIKDRAHLVAVVTGIEQDARAEAGQADG
jgi:hypothetical protein